MHLFTGSFIHSLLNKLSPYTFHGAGHVVSVHYIERITQTLHSSNYKVVGKTAKEMSHLHTLTEVLRKWAKVAVHTVGSNPSATVCKVSKRGKTNFIRKQKEQRTLQIMEAFNNATPVHGADPRAQLGAPFGAKVAPVPTSTSHPL